MTIASLYFFESCLIGVSEKQGLIFGITFFISSLTSFLICRILFSDIFSFLKIIADFSPRSFSACFFVRKKLCLFIVFMKIFTNGFFELAIVPSKSKRISFIFILIVKKSFILFVI